MEKSQEKKTGRRGRILRKLSGRGGFSLTELLAATLIMMMATGLLTQTLNLALDQFYKSTRESKAQILCSTLCTYVQNELTYAMVYADDSTVSKMKERDGAVCFDSGVHGMGKDARFVIKNGMLFETSDAYGKDYAIVGEGAYTVGKKQGDRLSAAITMKKDTFSIVAEIKVKDSQGNQLTGKTFRVIPLEWK